MTYVNSKFVYVERHIRMQFYSLYRDILEHRCQMEKSIIRQSLALASISPDELAWVIMKKPGYIGRVTGEVLHIITCIPVEVKIQQTEKCYEQLPVERNNETWYVLPKTHIITRYGTEITCSKILPQQFKIDGSWFKFIAKPIEAEEPEKIKINKKPTWYYKEPVALATTGIYSNDEIENVWENIMFPLQRPALLNNIARGITGNSFTQQGYLSNLITKHDLEIIGQGIWPWIWQKFTSFGEASAGFITIGIIVVIINNILGKLFDAYLLFRRIGLSFRLGAAISTSLTHLVLEQERLREIETSLQSQNIIRQKETRLDLGYQPEYTRSSASSSILNISNSIQNHRPQPKHHSTPISSINQSGKKTFWSMNID